MKSIIVLVIDHDTYESEEGKKLTPEELLKQGKFVNDDAAAIYGYECWETIFEVNPEFLAAIHNDGSSVDPELRNKRLNDAQMAAQDLPDNDE